jgi:DNA-binding CsgD family transcriptional regulator
VNVVEGAPVRLDTRRQAVSPIRSGAAMLATLAPGAGLGELLERETELALLRDHVRLLVEGCGGTVLIRAPAGVGKTALVDFAAVEGQTAGARVLRSSATELERELAFGVVRHLFERSLRELDPDERALVFDGAATLAGSVLTAAQSPPARAADVHAAMHGLYWLAAQLAAQRPLMLVVDDAHWADTASLRWLAYLARRLEGVALLIVVAFRPVDPSSDAELFDAMSANPDAALLEPRLLSEAGVRAWLERSSIEASAGVVAESCREVTGGNPFLLRELVASLERSKPSHDVSVQDVVAAAPDSVGRSVRARLGALGPDATTVAEAVAVLGGDARIDLVVALAGVAWDRAGEVLDALDQADVLIPGEALGFRHPLLRTAVYDQMPALRRSILHAGAADLMMRQERVEEAASHLLRAPPRGSESAVQALRTAASRAVARGAPEAAVPFLRRALDEPPPERAPVLLELALAEGMVLDPAATGHARAALEAARSIAERVRAAVALAQVLAPSGQFDEALELLASVDAAAQEADDADRLALEAQTFLISAWKVGAARIDVWPELLESPRLSGRTADERALLSVGVMRSLDLGQDCGRAVELARRALAHEDLSLPGNEVVPITCARALSLADQFGEAREALDLLNAGARRRGSLVGVCWSCIMRAELEFRVGRLVEAEVDAREGMQLALDHGLITAGGSAGFLADALLERISAAAALKALAELGLLDEPTGLRLGATSMDGLGGAILMHARGRAHARNDDLARAEQDLRTAGELQLTWGEANPAPLPWRSSLALVLAGLGRESEARALVEEEVTLARAFGAPRALGIALRARALLGSREQAVRELTNAEGVLAGSGAHLEHARVVVDLGVALRRVGRRNDARDTLRTGLDAASRCGAHPLAARARTELLALGSRPRRERLNGVEALTASERRVAELAASGRTNRQVAQELFVTLKTVEMHLSHVYAKLGISARKELPSALTGQFDLLSEAPSTG